MADISLPTPGQKPWSLNPAIAAINAESTATAATIATGRLSEAGLQSTIVATGLPIFARAAQTEEVGGPRFVRLNNGQPVFTLATQSPVAGASAAPSLYWPWIIDARRILGASALDEFYMYYSTDHEAVHENSGVWVATGPTEIGPWTSRGRVYRDDTSGNQTETPTVFEDPTGASKLIMLYQQASVSGSRGVQSTLWATSNDGITWTRGATAIDIPEWWPSDGHTGYARFVRIGRRMFSHHLAGGTHIPRFGLSTSSDGRQWNLQAEPLNYAMDQVGDGRRVEWNSGDVMLWKGHLWWVGLLANFAAGSDPKDARIASFPITANLRSPISAPTVHLYPTQGAETTNYRSLRTFTTRDGRTILYYQVGNSFYVAEAI